MQLIQTRVYDLILINQGNYPQEQRIIDGIKEDIIRANGKLLRLNTQMATMNYGNLKYRLDKMVSIYDWKGVDQELELVHELPLIESVEYLNSLAYNITITDISKIDFANSNVRIFTYSMLNTAFQDIVKLSDDLYT